MYLLNLRPFSSRSLYEIFAAAFAECIKVEEVQRESIETESSFVKVHGKRFPGERPKFHPKNWRVNEQRNMKDKWSTRTFSQKRNDSAHDTGAWTLVVNKNKRHKRDHGHKTGNVINRCGNDMRSTTNKHATGNKTRNYGAGQEGNA